MIDVILPGLAMLVVFAALALLIRFVVDVANWFTGIDPK